MQSIFAKAAACVAVSLTALAAHAATLDGPSVSGQKLGFGGAGDAFTAAPSTTPNTFSVRFDTGSGRRIAGRADFTVDNGMFNLSLGNLKVANPGSGLYALQDLSDLSFVEGDSGTNFGPCEGNRDRFPGLSVNVDCRRLGTVPDTAANAGDVLYRRLAAGSYAFLFFEGDDAPASGSFDLSISAVPTPAAGLLFGSVLVAATYMRRRNGLPI
ncbi:MAG: hypothetical protein AAF862_17245 [Pseudomonadota bacterium]